MRRKTPFKKILNYFLISLSVIAVGFLASVALDVYVYQKIGDDVVNDMTIGEKIRLDDFEIKYDKITTGDYTWKIDNENVVVIRDKQLVAVGIGKTKISVYDGVGSAIDTFELSVGFAVSEVEAAVRKTLNLEPYDALYEAEFNRVEKLDLSGIQLDTLSDLYVFKNLKKLNISNCPLWTK